MKINWKALCICIAIPLLLGGLAGFFARDSFGTYATLNKPPLSPPGWLFPVIWAILYILMGIASYLIFVSEATSTQKENALRLYALQLLFNFFWTCWFFQLQMYLFAFIWLIALWFLILATIVAFSRIQKCAGYLMLPYLLWVTFAGYLNLGIFLLN